MHPAPDRTGPGLRADTQWAIVLLLCACGVLGGAQFAKISVEFTRLQAAYGVSPARMGLLLSTVGVMGLGFGVVAGLLAPRVGYRRLLLVGLVGGGLLSGLQALLPPFGIFWASRVPEGASHLAIMVATPTLLIHVTAPAHRTAVMGMWATVVGLAFAVMAGLDRLLPLGLGPRESLAGHALLMGVAAGAVRLWVADVPVAGAPSGPARGLLALHHEVYANLRTALPGLAFFFYAFATIALITFVPRFTGLRDTAFMVVLPLAATAGTLAAGWVARHFAAGLGLPRLAYLGFGLSALGLGLAAQMGAPTEALALLTLGFAGLAGGAAATLIPQLNDAPAAQARASGVLVQMGNLGSVSGPPVFAAVADVGGLVALAALSALCCALAVGLLTVLGRAKLE